MLWAGRATQIRARQSIPPRFPATGDQGAASAAAPDQAAEYGGEAIRGLSMDGRMTVCNMTIEGGARAGRSQAIRGAAAAHQDPVRRRNFVDSQVVYDTHPEIGEYRLRALSDTVEHENRREFARAIELWQYRPRVRFDFLRE